jgi:hypothetical protein
MGFLRRSPIQQVRTLNQFSNHGDDSNSRTAAALGWIAQSARLLRLQPLRQAFARRETTPLSTIAFMDRDEKAKFENELIHQRLTWLGTFEGLLFVANSYGKHPYLLPIVGFLIAFSIDVGIREANDALTKLDAQPPQSWRRSFMPGVAIPKIIAVTWLVILWRISG